MDSQKTISKLQEMQHELELEYEENELTTNLLVGKKKSDKSDKRRGELALQKIAEKVHELEEKAC